CQTLACRPKCKCPVRPTPLRHVGAGRLRCASLALLPTDDLTEIFTFQELRRITAQLTVNDKRGLYVLEDGVERRCVRVAPVARSQTVLPLDGPSGPRRRVLTRARGLVRPALDRIVSLRRA